MIPAATVTFHPDNAWPTRLDAILREHPRVVVVDNSTSTTSRAFVADTVARRSGVSLHLLPKNPGIGAALNLAFATLSTEGHTLAVAFDQDSTPAEGFAAALVATATAYPRAAVIGANWIDPRRPGDVARFLRPAAPFGLGFCRTPATSDLENVICVINSGSLFDLAVWRKFDGFREELFLDLIDTDYCLRLRRGGHDIVACARAGLLHHRGEKQTVRLLGRDFFPAHTPLFRLRCLSKNRILLFRYHRLRPLAWVFYELAYAAKLVADALFLENGKAARLHAMLKGTLQGVLGQSGPTHRQRD